MSESEQVNACTEKKLKKNVLFKDKLLLLTPVFITNDRNKNVQMKKTHTRLLAATVLLFLLILQGVCMYGWLVLCVRKGREKSEILRSHATA